VIFPGTIPAVGSGWVTAKLDIVLSSGMDVTGQPTADGSYSWSWSPFVGGVAPNRDALTVRVSQSGVRITNPYILGEARSYDFYDWVPHGDIDNICLNDHCDAPEPGTQPVIDNTTTCDCTSPGSNPITMPDPYVPYAPIYACTGGGTVEQLADLPGIGGCWL
jgi:hypothetical protein